MRIAILGPGGVGGFVAGALWRAGEDVTIVARDETAALIAERGLDVASVVLGDFLARPAATARLSDPVDVLVVATKATALDAAARRIATVPPLVVPLLNGLDHLSLLRERFGPGRVAAGVIRIESDRPAPGRIVQTSPSVRIDLATAQAELRTAVDQLAAVLERAGVPVRIGAGEAAVMWSKLIRLNALALTTSAADRPLGAIRDDPEWRARLERAVTETAAVAVADGAALDPADTMAELESAHAGLGSSMQRDIAAGRTPELDAIAGAVLRAARRHGVACPTVAELARAVAARAGIAIPVA